mmetsp:Transcript_9165/g.13640  ORF Transcript_9165/g.13640 Transcript_9165/m.13640 type:complete len:105 (-) Transcript_9165:504-818(-)
MENQKLLKSGKALEKQSRELEDSKRSALESLGVAEGTMLTLKSQRDKIEKAAFSSSEINSNLAKSNKLITAIQRRELTNKLIMLGIIFLLFFSIMIVLYMKINA